MSFSRLGVGKKPRAILTPQDQRAFTKLCTLVLLFARTIVFPTYAMYSQWNESGLESAGAPGGNGSKCTLTIHTWEVHFSFRSAFTLSPALGSVGLHQLVTISLLAQHQVCTLWEMVELQLPHAACFTASECGSWGGERACDLLVPSWEVIAGSRINGRTPDIKCNKFIIMNVNIYGPDRPGSSCFAAPWCDLVQRCVYVHVYEHIHYYSGSVV